MLRLLIKVLQFWKYRQVEITLEDGTYAVVAFKHEKALSFMKEILTVLNGL